MSSLACVFENVVFLSPQVKCDHYWPFTEEPIAYGDITVEMISEKEQDDWACRHFRINYVSHEAQVQVLFSCWGNPQVSGDQPIIIQDHEHFGLWNTATFKRKTHFQCACVPCHWEWCGWNGWLRSPEEMLKMTTLFHLRLVQGIRRHSESFLIRPD